jgi:LacI family transcriptional regulator
MPKESPAAGPPEAPTRPRRPRAGGASVGIADVARLAGVSVTTVSHAISGKRPVSEATAEAVRRAAEELGYSPNRAARNLRLGVADTIGLIVPDIANPYFAELARGVEDVAAEAGTSVLLCNTDFSTERELRYLEVLRAGGADGVLYVAGEPPEPDLLRELGQTMPLIAVDEALPGSGATEVVSDNRGGGRLAGEHLLSLGHRRVLAIEGPRRLASAQERRRGLLEATAEASGTEVRTHPGDYLAASGEDAVRDALSGSADGAPWFTAVFAANDLMAIGAIAELRRHGVSVPADVSVVGFDDSTLASLISPALTTVRQDVGRLGAIAAERLLAAIEDPTAPTAPRATLPTELVVRESTAPARKEA